GAIEKDEQGRPQRKVAQEGKHPYRQTWPIFFVEFRFEVTRFARILRNLMTEAARGSQMLSKTLTVRRRLAEERDVYGSRTHKTDPERRIWPWHRRHAPRVRPVSLERGAH